MKNIKWLFFDVGSTLVSEDVSHKNRIDKLIASQLKLGRNLTYEAVYSQMVSASKKYSLSPFSEAMKNMGISEKLLYSSEDEKPYDNAVEILEALSNKYHIGIIGNQSAGTVARLEKYKLLKYIEVCISSTEEGVSKPDLEIFKLALKRANCKAEEAVMIGDRLDNDIFPAKKLGMKTIWVRQGLGGLQEPRSAEHIADFTISTLDELLKIL